MLSFVPDGMGGSETYARELARELELRENVDVGVVVPVNASGIFDVRDEIIVDSVRARSSIFGRLRALAATIIHSRGIRARMEADVVHFPFTISLPRPRRSARVITVLDVQHRDLPELFSLPERVFRHFLYDRAARKANLVVTISEFAREGIIKHLGVDANRVVAIPLGVSRENFTPNLGARQAFVLYPARGWKHKNHALLIEAMSRVRDENPGMRLVLTGGGLDALGTVPDWVDVRGVVPRDELAELYRKAAVLAFPSRYEGFGLPTLEAMASGCPVAAANAGSLPEVCGNAAVYFDPDSIADIARGILEAIDRSFELVPAGLARVTEFTWARCADEHIEAYRVATRLGAPAG